MAGHSQFKNIMHKKGKQDAIRSKLFSKLAREITVAAKMGLPDPAMNARLRAAVLAARAENMPKDNIERAIKKASGGDARELRRGALRGLCAGRRRRHRRGADRQPQPHRGRSALLFQQGGRRARGNRRGLLHVRSRRPDRISDRKVASDDAMLEAAIEAGADDVVSGPRSTRSSPRSRRCATRRRRSRRNSASRSKAALVWRPQNTIAVDDEAGEKILKLIGALEDNDDVQNVNANFEISDALMAKLSASFARDCQRRI